MGTTKPEKQLFDSRIGIDPKDHKVAKHMLKNIGSDIKAVMTGSVKPAILAYVGGYFDTGLPNIAVAGSVNMMGITGAMYLDCAGIPAPLEMIAKGTRSF